MFVLVLLLEQQEMQVKQVEKSLIWKMGLYEVDEKLHIILNLGNPAVAIAC